MVEFTLTDEQKDLRELAHDFAEKEIRPVAQEYDRDAIFPHEIIKKAHEVGLMNTHVPEEYGGAGPRLPRRLPDRGGARLGLLGHRAPRWARTASRRRRSIIGGSEEVKKEFLGDAHRGAEAGVVLPDRARGRLRRRLDAHRPSSRATSTSSTARRSSSPTARYADWYTVYAKTDPDAGHKGISAFVVPRDLPGVSVLGHEDKLGQRASDTAQIQFEDVEIPADYLLGEENHGFRLAMMVLDRTRPGVAAMATGIARAAFEHRRRVRQGARPVRRADRDAPGDPVHDRRHGDQGGGLAPAHLAVGRRCSTTGMRNTLAASHAKRFASDSAMEIATDAVQVYGGYGFIKEYPVEKLMRDAKIMQLYEGTSQIQRLVIAREVLMPRRVEEPAPAAA